MAIIIIIITTITINEIIITTTIITIAFTINSFMLMSSYLNLIDKTIIVEHKFLGMLDSINIHNFNRLNIIVIIVIIILANIILEAIIIHRNIDCITIEFHPFYIFYKLNAFKYM